MFPLFCRHGFQLSQALWGRDYQLPGAEGLRADQTHRGGRRRGADVGRCQTAGWGAAAWPRPRPGNMGKRLSENGLYPPSNFNGNLMKMDLRAYYFQTKPHFLCHLFGTWKLKKWWWKMVKKSIENGLPWSQECPNGSHWMKKHGTPLWIDHKWISFMVYHRQMIIRMSIYI